MSDNSRLIRLASGQEAWLVSHCPKHTVIRACESFPPGATARGTIEDVLAEFQLKVRNCRKDGELFLIEGRLQNATRQLNAKLTEVNPSSEEINRGES